MTSPQHRPPPPRPEPSNAKLAAFDDACAELDNAPLLHKGEAAGAALNALRELAADFDERLARLEAWRDQ